MNFNIFTLERYFFSSSEVLAAMSSDDWRRRIQFLDILHMR